MILLLITPRTFFVGGVGGGVGLLGRRGMISGSQGGQSVIGVGSRPWLQKVAALTVAVSLTIATADTFDVAERQYELGITNANDLRIEVTNSVQIKVSRVISDIFLWLAQVQTLIRLFPRHKEKVLIKWIGFALIVLDTTFTCLNSFAINKTVSNPRKLNAAIPALSYLFQLALSMLYASWVLYYVSCKRRYAFYHPLMWNMSVIALLSVVAIATPVVFFITDLANPTIAGWGDYFRWVGAAAASVIVWEWVERIEALEREEKKDGILGTEVFDGYDSDESDFLGMMPANRRRRRFWTSQRDGDTGATSGYQEMHHGGVLTRTRPVRDLPSDPSPLSGTTLRHQGTNINSDPNNNTLSAPTPPPVTVSPISRTDTASAASTIYNVQYNTLNLATPPVFRPRPVTQRSAKRVPTEQDIPEISKSEFSEKETAISPDASPQSHRPEPINTSKWPLTNPFKRRKVLPPEAVRQGQVIDPVTLSEPPRTQPIHNYAPWDIKSRIGAFAADRGEKWRDRSNRGHVHDDDLPVTIIPAQRRTPARRPWSPDTIENASQGSPVERRGLLTVEPPLRGEGAEGRTDDGELLNIEAATSPRQSSSAPRIDGRENGTSSTDM